MTLTELFPTIHSLPRADKLRLLQLLAADVATEEGVALDLADNTVPIWTPYEAFDGAATLLRVLDDEKVADVCFFRSRLLFEIKPKSANSQ